MPFPISCSGHFRAAGVTPEEAVARIERAIAVSRPRALRRHGNRLEFAPRVHADPSDLFRGRDLRIHSVWRGTVTAETTEGGTAVRYEASLWMVWAAMLMMPIVAMPSFPVWAGSARGLLVNLVAPWSLMTAFCYVGSGFGFRWYLVRAVSRPSSERAGI